jgi:hypothetical protein
MSDQLVKGVFYTMKSPPYEFGIDLKPASREETWKALSPDAKKLMKRLGIEFLHGEVK